MKTKRALISGATGMDASYLAEILLEKGYEVYGLVRRTSTSNQWRIAHIRDKIKLIYGDLTDQESLNRAVQISLPDEVYHLGAMSFVWSSFKHPEQTFEVNGNGTLKLLNAVRRYKPDARFYNAATSELFGAVKETPQNENTPFSVRSPYGISKQTAFSSVVHYREAYDMFACNGILFNHESERRGIEFVSRKITDAVARIKFGLQKELVLGNLDAKRDWGYAPEYCEAMWLILQQKKPDDFVIATGSTHSIREFVEMAFRYVNMDIKWEGEGTSEVGKYQNRTVVRVSDEFYRPSEVDILLGDATKARMILGWKPKTNLQQLVEIMMKADLERVEKGRIEL